MVRSCKRQRNFVLYERLFVFNSHVSKLFLCFIFFLKKAPFLRFPPRGRVFLLWPLHSSALRPLLSVPRAFSSTVCNAPILLTSSWFSLRLRRAHPFDFLLIFYATAARPSFFPSSSSPTRSFRSSKIHRRGSQDQNPTTRQFSTQLLRSQLRRSAYFLHTVLRPPGPYFTSRFLPPNIISSKRTSNKRS